MDQEIFYAMALTRLTNFNYQQALELYKAVGSAQMLFEHRNEGRLAATDGSAEGLGRGDEKGRGRTPIYGGASYPGPHAE